MQCDMCGSKVDSLSRGLVEGVTMSLCSNCIKYAKIIPKESPKKTHIVPSKIYHNKRVLMELESQEFIVDDYSDIIRTARQKKQMPQKALAVKLAEKESVIHSIETGKHEPSISLARRIEKLLGIKLVEETKQSADDVIKKMVSSNSPSGRSDSMTLGDAITFRTRKKN